MFKVEIEREDDGRWLAEVTALSRATALWLRVVADISEWGEPVPVEFVSART